jgi:response regulator RpfG family c-di-GMP phosphodiesterase
MSTEDQPAVHDLWLAEAERLEIPEQYLGNMQAFLTDMRAHHSGTYEHSMRVGILAPKIGALVPELEDFSQKALFYAGTLHDRGKLSTPRGLLDKTTEWTDEDAKALQAHPVESYKALVKEGMALTAGAVILHHTFQPNPYPAELPDPDPHLPEHLVQLQQLLGRVIALADFYDASHRKNSAGNLSAKEIQAKVYQSNPDLTELIDKLYSTGIFGAAK